ncbi:hypothetical protein D9Q98_008040 [Chlorella vulgaris]|uniref:Carboxypeptidase n=1 Tax=Chlorella vulgaris TaxID=3077 RepID=A0A9D4TI39_CHLVU|nr:hypothetical protein D9Q98_008040 [Chlorella vulgaris]
MSIAILLTCLLAVCGTATCQEGPAATQQKQQQRLTWNRLGGLGAPLTDAATPERYSGYFKLNRTYDAHMFFFYFQARKDPDNAPVVLWHTGGPGCSSELAVFFENGPWTINPADLTLNETEHGWDVNHHMIFVDQPINTGFSYSEDERDRCYDEDCVANDMVDFLGEFFKARSELQGRPFFVTGESYAGHYVPAVASAVFHASRSGQLDPPVNLQGLAIGNGLTNPAIQYGAYSDYALLNGLIGQGLAEKLKLIYPACRVALEVCDGLDFAFECLLAVQFCQMTQFVPVMIVNADMNVYDIRKQCEGPLCYREFEVLDRYLNQPSVRRELGVGDRVWEACNMGVHSDMMSDWGHNFDTVLPELLKAGVRVMIYAGDQDFICNHVGNRQWVDVLPWHDASRWALAADQSWEVEGGEAGTVKQVGPMSFVTVFQAGHMVPMDQGKHALDMITRFSRDQPLHQPPAGSNGHTASGRKVLPGATWKLRRAGAGGQGGRLVSGSSEEVLASAEQ